MPVWWLNASGVFFILAIIFMVMGIITMGALFWLILELRDHARTVKAKVDTIGDDVKSISGQVNSITTDVGIRAKGVMGLVDDTAQNAYDGLQKFAPIIIGAGIIWRLKSLIGGRS